MFAEGVFHVEHPPFPPPADADNPSIVNYELTRGGEAVALRIENNRILNRHPNARLLRNATSVAPVIAGNEVINEGRGKITGVR